MSKELIVSSNSLETKLAILEDDQVTEIFIERAKNIGILGSIYKAKVTKVLPGMQAAFVDIGLERHAFLYVTDFFESLEEYEEIFVDSDSVGKILKAEKVQPEEAKRPARRRGRRSRTKTEKGPQQKAAPAPEAKKAESLPEQTMPEQAMPVIEEGQFILPETLPFWQGTEESSAAVKPWLDESELPREEPQILPDRLETIVEFEPEGESGSELADAEARLNAPDKPPEMATNQTRSRKRMENARVNPAPLIGDLLRQGQEILVQIAKEPIAKKGARITSHVALPGRFLVYMPTVDHVGVSRKIASDKERQRLRDIVVSLRGEINKGFIVRTAGEGRSEEDLRRDALYLSRLWDDIRVKAEKASAPALIHSEPSLGLRIVRDYFSNEYRAIRVDDEHEYERIVDLVSQFNPDLVQRVRLYNRSTPIFDQFGISAEVERSLKPKVWLKNGGYIVINQTEALVAIDVNTGKFVGRTASLEDTITKTNLDAVKEVVRQIRLRDLGGIIVIDFIDMDERKNRQKVMDALEQELSKDKSPSKILQFNEFGLVAITRKRAKQSLERTLCQPCLYCTGTGVTKSVRTVSHSIHQEVRRLLPQLGSGAEILIRCHPDVAKALRESEQNITSEIEEMTGRIVSIKADPLMHIEQFDVVEL
ncbi:MAG: Rne/Rng family ribonuclease [Acidobacteriota bacterium]